MKPLLLVVAKESRHDEHWILGEERMEPVTIDARGLAIEDRTERKKPDVSWVYHARSDAHAIERNTQQGRRGTFPGCVELRERIGLGIKKKLASACVEKIGRIADRRDHRDNAVPLSL